MIGFLKRLGHGVLRRNIHTWWAKTYIHVHSVVVRFVHTMAWMFIAVSLTGSAVHKIQDAGAKFSHLWANNMLSRLTEISSWSWEERLALLTVLSLPFMVHAAWKAEEDWRKWFMHGHHLDDDLNAPEPGETSVAAIRT